MNGAAIWGDFPQGGGGFSRIPGHGSKMFQPHGLLDEAYGEGGQPEEGLPLMVEALAVMDTTEVRFYQAKLYRLKGELLLRQAALDASQAEACFHQAKSLELHAATRMPAICLLRSMGGSLRDLTRRICGRRRRYSKNSKVDHLIHIMVEKL